MVGFGRFIRHLLLGDYLTWRFVSSLTRQQIEERIGASEQRHACQICCVLEGGMHGLDLIKGVTPRQRAVDLFSIHRIWDTEENLGVLLYVCFADRDVEIVVDRGVRKMVPQAILDRICKEIEKHFRDGKVAAGLAQAIDELSRVLELHFPKSASSSDEISNKPIVR